MYTNVNRCMRWHIFSSSHLFYTASFDKLKQYYYTYSYNTKTPPASPLTVKKTNTPFSIFKYLLLMMMGRANPSFPFRKSRAWEPRDDRASFWIQAEFCRFADLLKPNLLGHSHKVESKPHAELESNIGSDPSTIQYIACSNKV